MPLNLAYEPRYALNAVCPYFTVFPLEYPLRVLKKHRKSLKSYVEEFCEQRATFSTSALFSTSGLGSSDVSSQFEQFEQFCKAAINMKTVRAQLPHVKK